MALKLWSTVLAGVVGMMLVAGAAQAADAAAATKAPAVAATAPAMDSMAGHEENADNCVPQTDSKTGKVTKDCPKVAESTDEGEETGEESSEF
ncbi:MAG: hypothetical protein K0R63_157 [Rickettsiales bacterium]|nr:hypothetical protein [Rickettsiales bacterium]